MPAAPSPPDTISGSSDTGPCPQVWIRNGGRCYFFSSAEKTWDASQTNCSTQGGFLVAMDTPEERDFVFGSQPPTYFWLDACKEDVGKPWKRADGSLFNNTFPIVGEGLCAYMNERTPSSTWCDSNRQWICTKPEDSF
ncbi:PREDICTED: C-type lectin domain family 2 member D-like [Gekko japonicus]|uniref:C-type lectin domain family 2 member D-like n=1 Tax=Gekko japonicus TaxID=146911 RepID=A0ABM1K314_GEKJA|nr:PREDICTED: C-type lectin domain family 2 member D-like [Gekko japonicus]